MFQKALNLIYEHKKLYWSAVGLFFAGIGVGVVTRQSPHVVEPVRYHIQVNEPERYQIVIRQKTDSLESIINEKYNLQLPGKEQMPACIGTILICNQESEEYIDFKLYTHQDDVPYLAICTDPESSLTQDESKTAYFYHDSTIQGDLGFNRALLMKEGQVFEATENYLLTIKVLNIYFNELFQTGPDNKEKTYHKEILDIETDTL